MSTDDTPPGPGGIHGDTPNPGVEAPPPPPASGRPFRLVRARTDRKLGGVAAGLATAAGLDPTLVRMGLAVGALTGWAILAYLIAWVVIPEEDEAAGRTLEPASEDTARLVRIGLAVIAGLGALQIAGIVAGVAFAVLGTISALFHPFIDPFAGDYGGFNPDFPVRGMAGLVLLAAGGVFLLRRRSREDVPPPGAPFAGSGGSGFPPPGSDGTPPPPPPGGGAPPGRLALPGPRGPGAVATGGRNWRTASEWLLLGTRATGWLIALWFALFGAVLAALWALDAVQVRLPFLLALATLGTLGLMGTVLVRSRRPALLAASTAALLVPVALTLVLGSWNGVAGYRVVTPSSTADLPRVYRHSFGELRLDLSQLSLPAGTTEVKVEMGAGETAITVPWDATVEAVARVGAGEFNLLGRSQAGLSLEGEVRSEGEPGAPTLKVLGRVSAGQLKLFRRSPPATKLALEAGQAVRLQCNEERDGLRCLSPDGYATPPLECLVSAELESTCRPPGQPLEAGDFPGDRTGLRRCSVPAGGGLAACTGVAQAPPAEPPPAPQAPAPAPPPAAPAPATSMPPGTYVCDFPADGGPASCRPA